MGLKQILHSVGLTKETHEELSDILADNGFVNSKVKIPEHGMPPFGLYRMDIGGLGPELAAPLPDKYMIEIVGMKSAYRVNNKSLYDQLSEGDKVRIRYQEVYSVLMDYLAPDFAYKQEISRELVEKRLVSAEKVTK